MYTTKILPLYNNTKSNRKFSYIDTENKSIYHTVFLTLYLYRIQMLNHHKNYIPSMFNTYRCINTNGNAEAAQIQNWQKYISNWHHLDIVFYICLSIFFHNIQLVWTNEIPHTTHNTGSINKVTVDMIIELI